MVESDRPTSLVEMVVDVTNSGVHGSPMAATGADATFFHRFRHVSQRVFFAKTLGPVYPPALHPL